ncbi:hypothetical protein T11_9296, partial [Trichinella zimbabwensis]
ATLPDTDADIDAISIGTYRRYFVHTALKPSFRLVTAFRDPIHSQVRSLQRYFGSREMKPSN